MFGAVERADLAQVLLDHGADVNAVDPMGRTPLFAVQSPAVATLLETHGARLDVRDKRGESPMQYAALSGRHLPELVDWYLAHGSAPDVWTMAALGRTEEVRKLVEETPSLARKLGPDGSGPLNWAIVMEHADTVRVLLQHGADPNQIDSHLEAPLHLAIYHPDMIEPLLAAHADPNVLSGSGDMPLHVAAREGLLPSLKLLLAHGAHVDGHGKDGNTPLLVACGVPKPNVGVIEALLDAGANPNAKGLVGQTPLTLCHDPAIVALLLAHDAKH